MDFFSAYLNHHNINKDVIFIGDINNISYAYKDSKDIIIISKVEELSNIEHLNKKTLVITDSALNEINTIIKFKYHAIIGYFNEKVDTFELFKQLIKCSSNITLSRYKDYRSNEILRVENYTTDKPLLSVILPTYNVEKYLDKCISSLIGDNNPFIEFLFIDDGSIDNSKDIIEKYQKIDKRIKYIYKQNGGCASARELGLQNSLGKYVGFVDPDDFVDSSMFTKLLTKAFTGDYDIAYCGYNNFYESTQKNEPIPDAFGDKYLQGIYDYQKCDELIYSLRIGIWRCIFKKDMLLNNDIHFNTNLKRFDDLPFQIQALAKANSVIALKEYLYYYRLQRPGQDVSVNDERLYVHFDIFSFLDKYFVKFRSMYQKDYYIVRKLQTHYWGTTKLKKELKRTYCEKAKNDLLAISNKEEIKSLSKVFLKRRQRKIIKYILSL